MWVVVQAAWGLLRTLGDRKVSLLQKRTRALMKAISHQGIAIASDRWQMSVATSQELQKWGAATLYMPLWELEELLDCRA